MKKLSQLIFLIIPLVLPSCARRINVTNNTFADYQAIPHGFAKGSAFFIEPIKNQNELFGKEVTHKIKTLLHEHGFGVATADKAQYAISATLIMTPSKIKIQVPYYTPGEQISVQGCRHTGDDDQYYEEVQQTAGSTKYVTEERTVFEHHLQLQVYALNRTKDAMQRELVWQGAANMRGDESDQREILDYLLVSAFNYFGINTKKHVITNISESHKTMKRLRR